MTVPSETGLQGHGRGAATAPAGWPQRLAGLRRSFVRDLDDGRGFLWWPVGFAIGAALYFAPMAEPGWPSYATAGLGALSAVAVLAVRRSPPPLVVILAALVGVGFLHAALVTRLAAHPVITGERTVTVHGYVVAIEDRGQGAARLLVQPVTMDPRQRDGLPPRIRVTTRGGAPLAPGDAVTMLARLAPPMPPPLPGGYDFARVSWFRGIGAGGFTYGAVKPWPDAPPPGWWLAVLSGIETVRVAAASRIRASLAGDTGAIAAALIVGDRAGISEATNEAMRVAGVSHVLSISGVHMSLVAACLFGGVRLVLALIPTLALSWPIKKMAALIAMVGTSLYFVVSGMDVPAERSMIMVLVSLLAVLIDRRALSMRVIAVAALVTLVLTPEAVVDPGAQMSFAAVIALMASLEAYAGRQADSPDGGDINLIARAVRWLGLWVAAALATTLVAGLATLPMALYHFGRLAPLGMVANLLSAPLVSVLIMPFALVTALLLPVHLEALPLAVMGWGIDAMIAIARDVAAWTPGGGLLGRPDGWTMVLAVAGGLWLCLWRGTKRWLGAVAFAGGFALALLSTPPGLIVAGDGTLVLIRNADGSWAKVGRTGGFMLDVWLAAVGADPSSSGTIGDNTLCDDEACVLTGAAPPRAVAVVARPVAFGDECAAVGIIVAAIDAPPWCQPSTLRLDAEALRTSGTRTYDLRVGETGTVEVRQTGQVFGDPRRLWQAAAR